MEESFDCIYNAIIDYFVISTFPFRLVRREWDSRRNFSKVWSLKEMYSEFLFPVKGSMERWINGTEENRFQLPPGTCNFPGKPFNGLEPNFGACHSVLTVVCEAQWTEIFERFVPSSMMIEHVRALDFERWVRVSNSYFTFQFQYFQRYVRLKERRIFFLFFFFSFSS